MPDIPDGVKPCPAHSAESCDVSIAHDREPGTWQVVADCGVAGPHGYCRDAAVSFWNQMQRREEPVRSRPPLADGRWRDDYVEGGTDDQ